MRPPDSRNISCSRFRGRAVVEGVEHRWAAHSPAGFEWGYRGSGPSDLALNILLSFTDDKRWSWSRHHAFREAFIAGMPWAGGVIEASAVEEWIRARRPGGQTGPAASRPLETSAETRR